MNKEFDVRCQKDENENCALDAKSHENVEFQSIFELVRVIQKWIDFIATFTKDEEDNHGIKSVTTSKDPS